MAIGRGKSLKLINAPSHSPNDGQASPCLNSIPLEFLSSSLVPSYAFYFLITVLYMHHNPSILISPSVPASLGTCFSLSSSIQSWWNQPKYIHHSKLSPTISHHPLCKWNYPLNPHHSHCIQIQQACTQIWLWYCCYGDWNQTSKFNIHHPSLYLIIFILVKNNNIINDPLAGGRLMVGTARWWASYILACQWAMWEVGCGQRGTSTNDDQYGHNTVWQFHFITIINISDNIQSIARPLARSPVSDVNSSIAISLLTGWRASSLARSIL